MKKDTSPPIKVFHIVTDLARHSGISTWMSAVLSAPVWDEFEHTLCYTGTLGSQSDRLTELASMCNRVIQLRCTAKNLMQYTRALNTELRAQPYKILHTHHDWNGGLETFIARTAGITGRILYFHTGGWQHAPAPLKWVFARFNRLLGLISANAFWAPSYSNLTTWFGNNKFDPPRFAVLPSGINFEYKNHNSPIEQRRELDIPEHCFVVGHVGRMSEPKNHLALLKAFSILKTLKPDSHLFLAGDGPLRNHLQKMANDLDITESVTFAGSRKDIYDCLNAMDVFVFPSKYESLGLAVLEAQNVGLPIVAANVPGLREAVAPCWHQYLANPEDPKDIAKHILNAAAEPRLRPTEFLTRYDNVVAAEAIKKQYLALCNRTRVMKRAPV